MGIAGWNVLSTHEVLAGTIVDTHYSGGNGVTSDYDWNVIIQPAAGYEHLAVNSAGVTNATGQIECKIHINGSKVDGSYWGPAFFNRLGQVGWNGQHYSVEVAGVWCEDLSHGNKTEIHPIQTMKAFIADDAHGPSWWIAAFSESWNLCIAQPKAPPADHVPVNAVFALPWPAQSPGTEAPPIAVQYDDPHNIVAASQAAQDPGQTYTVTVNTGPAGCFTSVVALGWTRSKGKEHKDTAKDKDKEHKDGKEGGHGKELELHATHSFAAPQEAQRSAADTPPAGTKEPMVPAKDRPLEA